MTLTYLKNLIEDGSFKTVRGKEIILKTHVGDGISNYSFKVEEQLLMKPSKYLINLFFIGGVFPELFKPAVIIPLHKTGSRNIVSQYKYIVNK